MIAAMADLNKAQTQLDEKEKELEETMKEYNTAMSEKQRLTFLINCETHDAY